MFSVAPLPALGTADRLIPSLDQAVAQGFRAVEPWFAAGPGNRGDAGETLAVSQAAGERGLRIAAVRDASFTAGALARDSAEAPRAALQPWIERIAHAARLGAAACVILPPAQERGATVSSGRAERLAGLAAGLCRLRFDAEAAAVTLALELASPEWLATPAEAADFLDHVNSPCVGLRLDAREACVQRDLADWISVTGRRLVGVVWPGGPDNHALDELLERLRRARYDGPVTLLNRDGQVLSGEELRAAMRRIDRSAPSAAGTG